MDLPEYMDLLDYINSELETKESKRFRMRTVLNNHLSLFQDFNRFHIQLLVSHSSCDEHNWIIGVFVFFWGFEFSWNGRKNKLNNK